jgi:serpin B
VRLALAAMRLALVALALGLALSACGAATRTPWPSPAPPSAGLPARIDAAARSTNRLALALMGRLGGSGNVVFSPYSIDRALAMVDQGAGGETLKQIDRVLGAPAPMLASSHRALRKRLAADASQEKSADAVWLQAGVALEQPFSGTLAGDFGAPPRTVDFEADPAAAARTINAWAASATGNLIRDLMPRSALSRSTKLVLADAVYLKARWQYPFAHSMTHPQPFLTSTGRSVSTPFMSRMPVSLGYSASSSYRAVELPYRNSNLSMLLVMPPAGALPRLESSLNLAAIEGSLHPTLLALSMPRFDLLTHAQLGGVLASLGMPLAFSRQADFSGITKQVSLRIQAVEHGAQVRVDEAGTVAAAATGISLTPTLAVRPATRLVLDHPFLAFIRDRRTGAILFATRVIDPTQKS